MGIFDKIQTAQRGAMRTPRLLRGKYLVEIKYFGVKESKTNQGSYVLLEGTVLETISGFDGSNRPGDAVSKAFLVQDSGWAGTYAMGEVCELIAAATGASPDEVTPADAEVATSEGGEALRGVKIIVDVFPGSKLDPRTQEPYMNYKYYPTAETSAGA